MRLKGIFVVAAVAAMLVTGCSGSVSERRKIDYKSAGRLPPLEVPPDLATPQNSERFNVPADDGATFSGLFSGTRCGAQRHARQFNLARARGDAGRT